MECCRQAHSVCAVAVAVPLGSLAAAMIGGGWPPCAPAPVLRSEKPEASGELPGELTGKLPTLISCPEGERPHPADVDPELAASGLLAHVVYANNAKYLPGALVSILSLARELRDPERCRIHLLASDADNITRSLTVLGRCIRRELQDMRQLPRIDQHVFRPVPLDLENMAMTLRYNGHLVNTYPFIRFYLHEYLPAAQRVLWLDSDTILLADVTALFTMSMGHAVAAVQDGIKPTLQSYHDIYEGYGEVQERLGPHRGAPSLQSGVLLVDAERWRSGTLTRELEAWTRRLAGGSDADQAVLNVQLLGGFDRLDWRWNLAGAGSSIPILPRCLAEAKVVHFSGGAVRPWIIGPGSEPVAIRRYCELFERFKQNCVTLQCSFAEA